MSQFEKPDLKKTNSNITEMDQATEQERRCGPVTETQNQLRLWYGRYPGLWLLEQEQKLLETVLADLFGYHILQIGMPNTSCCLNVSRIPHQMVMDMVFPGSDTNPKVECHQTDFSENITDHFYGEPEYIPLAADSLDVLILSHTLEFCANPHEVLREVDRILIPEGNVIILGFNPWGLWLPWRLLLGWRKKVPWCGRFISVARLKDWLQLLGFDITESRRFFFRPPLSQAGVMKHLQFLEKWGRRLWPFLGGAYFLVARKRMATLTPIKPRWRPRRSRLVNTGLAGNSTSMSNRNND
jgi:SAM-dependent methyltransferase